MHTLLLEQGLGRYYALAGSQVAPVSAELTQRSHLWLEPLLDAAKVGDQPVCSLQLDVQGIHCAACVWLMNQTYQRHEGAVGLTVNPALGTLRLAFKRDFDVERWLGEVEAFGYQFGPARKESRAGSIELPLRLGISAALAINVMLFSISFYFGLTPREPDVFQLFTRLSFLLSTGVVIIGGWPFFKAAVLGLRRGVLHLDLPIAVGIALVYGMSLVQMRAGRGDVTYFDTLNTFITLMLVGRWLQERIVERNRRYLLEDDGADGLMVRVVDGTKLVPKAAPKVRLDDVLLVAAGELVPVDAVLLDEAARVSVEWMTGESKPLSIARGAKVPAGSFNASGRAFHVRAVQSFADSALVALLREAPERVGHVPKHQVWWNTFARSWVIKVFVVATLGFLAWLPFGFDRAVNVAVALLVVTCPCAIGLAIPLAYELTQARLRRAGFYVRSRDLLDRLLSVKKVLFDKTGTLTLGRLELTDPTTLDRLDSPTLTVLYNLTARSTHPVSQALTRALTLRHVAYEPALSVTEHDGLGLEAQWEGHTWKLGRASWAGSTSGNATVLSRDGAVIAEFATREALRRDARKELASLQREGLSVWLISGDSQPRVTAMAEALAVPTAQALGGLRPEEKANVVKRLDAQDTLYLGDGVNDALAFEQALAAGTPAVDRPVMPGKSDFFLVGEGLTPLREGLARALHLRRIVQRILSISLGYNVLAIGACLLGKMSPLAAAISMPASTVTLLLVTTWSLRRADSADASPASLRNAPAVVAPESA